MWPNQHSNGSTNGFAIGISDGEATHPCRARPAHGATVGTVRAFTFDLRTCRWWNLSIRKRSVRHSTPATATTGASVAHASTIASSTSVCAYLRWPTSHAAEGGKASGAPPVPAGAARASPLIVLTLTHGVPCATKLWYVRACYDAVGEQHALCVLARVVEVDGLVRLAEGDEPRGQHWPQREEQQLPTTRPGPNRS